MLLVLPLQCAFGDLFFIESWPNAWQGPCICTETNEPVEKEQSDTMGALDVFSTKVQKVSFLIEF